MALLPLAAFLATFGVFFVDKNREARTVLDSGRGLLTIATIVVGYVAIALVVRRLSRWTWLPPVILAVVVLGLAAWTVRPYYVDETVNRRLVTGPIRESSDGSTTIVGAAPGGPPPTGSAPPEAGGAVRLAAGQLQGLGHDAAGSVSLLEAADGTLTVRLEAFDIEGVPDPQVYLIDGAGHEDPGGVGLGRLPGNRGDILDIAVPAEGRPAGPAWTLLVWCGRFSVPVANATLTTRDPS